MDELILVEIARQVHSVDQAFIDSRIGMIEKVTQWNGALYLNWRRHLLAKKVGEKKLLARVHGDRRDEYMKWRCLFSDRKYEKPDHFPRNTSQVSLHSSASSNSLSDQSTDDSPPPSPFQRVHSQSAGSNSLQTASSFTPHSPAPTTPSSASSASTPSQPFALKPLQLTSKLNSPKPEGKPSPQKRPDVADYTFSGMHHIFVETTHPITCIQFGNNDNDILAFGSHEGHIYVCSALKSPRLLHTLKGHSSAITALRWANSNDLLISTSTDSVRVWDRKTGLPTKILKEAGLSCCLNPVNDSTYLISDNKGYIKVINTSTGKSVLRVKALANITCMQFDTLGHFLFAGDDKGFVEVFKYTKDSGALQILSKTPVSNMKPVVSISFKGIYANQQFSPSIIVSCKDNTIKMFTMKNSPNPGTLILTKEFHIQNKKDPIRSMWCPFVDSPCIVSGTENSGIYFFDMRGKDKPINTLMGHSGSVLDISWCNDESLLASSDTTGMVILWTRKR